MAARASGSLPVLTVLVALVTGLPLAASQDFSEGRTVKAVEFRVRFQVDYDKIADDAIGFSTMFTVGISTVLEVEAQRIDVLKLSPGSVVKSMNVDFRIRDPLPGQTVLKSAEEAANRFEALMTANNYIAFPANMRSLVRGSEMETRVEVMSTPPTPGIIEMAPLQDEYTPPSGCKCVNNTAAGIPMGCANHLALDRPWCPVNSDCPKSRVREGTGVQSRWAFCSKAADGTSTTQPAVAEFPAAGSTSRASMASESPAGLPLALSLAVLILGA